jgi:hypothetical protein
MAHGCLHSGLVHIQWAACAPLDNTKSGIKYSLTTVCTSFGVVYLPGVGWVNQWEETIAMSTKMPLQIPNKKKNSTDQERGYKRMKTFYIIYYL